jgi:hypothetical protein
VRGGKTLGVAVPTAMVGAGTAANRLAGLPVASLAATPRAVESGRLWLLVTSGLLASDPWLPSLLGFAIVLAVAVWVLSPTLVAGVATAGQVLSAVAVYAVVYVARAADPHAFASVIDLDDYGVSTMIAAWIGAVATVGWNRWRTGRGRLGVSAGCLACLAIGLACRPDVDFLDSEHLVAFAIGVTLASSLPRRFSVPLRRSAAIALAALTRTN